ncbi:MAG: hypothetical protein KDD36_03520 [Flavobacteriales bacterium]|nr:hypothetical protein [Flavobacteriales bacterium]
MAKRLTAVREETATLIRTDIHQMELTEEGILYITASNPELDHIDVSRQLVDEMAWGFAKLANGIPRPMLFDLDSRYVSINKDVREYIASHPLINRVKKAEAIVTSSLASRLIVNTYLTINTPPRPARMFKDVESAKKWLRKFL